MGERRALAEYRQLRRSAFWPAAGAPDGTGRGALLIGGFGVPRRTLAPLARWLRGSGWQVDLADLGWNTGCGTAAVERIEQQLSALARRTGPVAVVGHSRGGVVGRVAAVRSPDTVETLVTVCTPWALGPPDRPGVGAMTAGLQLARRHGVDLMASIECATGPCCTDFRAQMGEIPPCPWTLIRSTGDDIAGDLAIASGATHEAVIGTSHLGAVLSIDGWQAIGAALSRPA